MHAAKEAAKAAEPQKDPAATVSQCGPVRAKLSEVSNVSAATAATAAASSDDASSAIPTTTSQEEAARQRYVFKMVNAASAQLANMSLSTSLSQNYSNSYIWKTAVPYLLTCKSTVDLLINQVDLTLEDVVGRGNVLWVSGHRRVGSRLAQIRNVEVPVQLQSQIVSTRAALQLLRSRTALSELVAVKWGVTASWIEERFDVYLSLSESAVDRWLKVDGESDDAAGGKEGSITTRKQKVFAVSMKIKGRLSQYVLDAADRIQTRTKQLIGSLKDKTYNIVVSPKLESLTVMPAKTGQWLAVSAVILRSRIEPILSTTKLRLKRVVEGMSDKPFVSTAQARISAVASQCKGTYDANVVTVALYRETCSVRLTEYRDSCNSKVGEYRQACSNRLTSVVSQCRDNYNTWPLPNKSEMQETVFGFQRKVATRFQGLPETQQKYLVRVFLRARRLANQLLGNRVPESVTTFLAQWLIAEVTAVSNEDLVLENKVPSDVQPSADTPVAASETSTMPSASPTATSTATISRQTTASTTAATTASPAQSPPQSEAPFSDTITDTFEATVAKDFPVHVQERKPSRRFAPAPATAVVTGPLQE